MCFNYRWYPSSSEFKSELSFGQLSFGQFRYSASVNSASVNSISNSASTDKLVVVFWKYGLLKLWGANKWKDKLEPQVSDAVHRLGSEYPPPAPKKRDSRHQTYETESERFGEDNCGVYNFAR